MGVKDVKGEKGNKIVQEGILMIDEGEKKSERDGVTVEKDLPAMVNRSPAIEPALLFLFVRQLPMLLSSARARPHPLREQ